jgi:hypothetical protein
MIAKALVVFINDKKLYTTATYDERGKGIFGVNVYNLVMRNHSFKAACLQISQNISRKTNLRKVYLDFEKK